MSAELHDADSRRLHDQFSARLRAGNRRAALAWLTDVLAGQAPGLRSSNCSLVAYTGCGEAIDWLEASVASPVTAHWGQAAALLGTPWPRMKTWLAAGGARQMMALDALLACRAPAPNMAPLAQIAAPVLPDAPTAGEYAATLVAVVSAQSSPRIRKTVDSALACAAEILARKDRGVSVADLPLLFLQADSFAGAAAILSRHAAVISGMRRSVEGVRAPLPPRR